ncbi:MAG: adenylate/guanylate cyclase domain-containing protein [Gammaproteobacteria bacterium]
MTGAFRTAVAFAAGVGVACLPPLAADRTSADWIAAAHAWWQPTRPASDVILVLLDRRTLAHPAFAGRPRAAWGEPLAQLMESLLDAGVDVLALDVVLPRDDAPALMRVIRRGARDGKLVLGMVAGAAGAAPARAQLVAAGGTRVLAAVNLELDASGRVRTLSQVNGGLPTIGAAMATRAGASAAGVARLLRGALPTLTAWSAADVLDCKTPARLVDAFVDRVVLIGAWLPHEDRHASVLGRLPDAARKLATGTCNGAATTLAFGGDAPGVLLHGLAADHWLHRTALVRLPRAVEVALMAVGALAGAYAHRDRRRWLLVAILLVAWTAVAIGAAQTWLLPWLAVCAALLTAAAAAVALRTAWYARRLAATVPHAFRATPDATQTRTVTACFIDIESFTAATEAIGNPAHVAEELAACLHHLSKIVERNHGFVDKYLGDGLLALFGVDGGDGRADSVAAALACLDACTDGRLRFGGRPLSLRIGLAAGPARVGTLHAGERLHFTAVGDPINVAARLEQLNRALGTRGLADASVAAGVPDAVWRDLGEHALRGRRANVRVFELTRSATRL